MVLTEFQADGKWRCSPVDPRLSLHNLQPCDNHANMHTASKSYHD